MIFIVPNRIFAANMDISAGDTVSASDTSIISVFLNTEGQLINSIDGSIKLSDQNNGNFEIKDINLANSVFTIWPRKPSLQDGHSIVFVGGVPGGLSGSRLLLFQVIVKINEPGEFKITPKDTIVYINDGLGTPIEIEEEIFTIIVGEEKGEPQNEWQEIISKDNTAPLPFKVTLMQDEYIYEGRKFIAFETVDTESGISYYEVKEGGYPSVRSGTNYILIDQDNSAEIVVTAYDKAGNFQVSTLKKNEPIHWESILLALLIIFLIFGITKWIKGRIKIKKHV